MTTTYESPVAERVQAGIAWLDENEPGWRDRIDPSRLQLSSPHNCVVGQVFRDDISQTWHLNGYGRFRHLYEGLTFNDVIARGFEVHTETYDDLTEAWRTALQA